MSLSGFLYWFVDANIVIGYFLFEGEMIVVWQGREMAIVCSNIEEMK
jgi:hypothetical protein